MKTFRPILVALAMLAASLSAVGLDPTKQLADEKDAVVLDERDVPACFGDWAVDPVVIPVSVSPEVQVKLDAICNQPLARTYPDAAGQRLMLSIAYGRDQGGEGTQVHRPEFCYTAQGFHVTKNMVGDHATLPGIGRKLNQLAYGLTGKVPDGMLVRVSTIAANEQDAYRLEDEFINQLLAAMSLSTRTRIAGKVGA